MRNKFGKSTMKNPEKTLSKESMSLDDRDIKPVILESLREIDFKNPFIDRFKYRHAKINELECNTIANEKYSLYETLYLIYMKDLLARDFILKPQFQGSHPDNTELGIQERKDFEKLKVQLHKKLYAVSKTHTSYMNSEMVLYQRKILK
jgi:hypothetical protein